MRVRPKLDRAFPVRRQDLVVIRHGGHTGLRDAVTGELHLLNETAMAVWEVCDGHTSGGEIVTAICELTGLPEVLVVEDLERIVPELEKAGLLMAEGQCPP